MLSNCGVFSTKPCKQADGRTGLAAGDQDERQIVCRLSVVRPPRQRVAEAAFRLFEIPVPAEQQAEIVQRFGEVRLQRERFLVERLRFPVASGQQERVAQIVERVRVFGRRRQRLPEAIDGRIELPGLREERAEVVARFGEIRLERERALERRAGLLPRLPASRAACRDGRT